MIKARPVPRRDAGAWQRMATDNSQAAQGSGQAAAHDGASLAERLTAAERNHARSATRLRPKPAATLIILDHSGAEPTVLMGRRNPAHKFMPGKFVFPGGRVDPVDRHMRVALPLHTEVQDRLLAHLPRRGPAMAQALALAAIRETFEETGLVLGAPAALDGRKVPQASGAIMQPTASRPTCRSCLLSPMQLRRPSGRGASTLSSSSLMRR